MEFSVLEDFDCDNGWKRMLQLPYAHVTKNLGVKTPEPVDVAVAGQEN